MVNKKDPNVRTMGIWVSVRVESSPFYGSRTYTDYIINFRIIVEKAILFIISLGIGDRSRRIDGDDDL